MSAPSSIATPVVPPAAGGATVPKTAAGPLSGFEQLLAALFGQGDAAGVAPSTSKAGSKAGKTDATADAATDLKAKSDDADPIAAQLDPTSDPAAVTAVLALVAPSMPAPCATPTPTPTEGLEIESKAFGQGKASGIAAAPALANADPHARLTEKAAISLDGGEVEQPALPTPKDILHLAKAELKAAASAIETASRGPTAQPVATTGTLRDEPLINVPPEVATAPAAEPAATATPAVATALATPSPVLSPRPSPVRTAQLGKSDRVTNSLDAVGPAKAPASGHKAADSAAVPDIAAAPAAEAHAAEVEGHEAKGREAGEPAAASTELPAQASATAQAVHAAHTAVRGAPETVANLAAQIIKKLDARTSRFDVQLDPAGLGKVDVRIEIGAAGQLTAALSFDNPQAASELKSRAGELHRALEQAGFDMTGGLSFDVAGDRGQARQGWEQAGGEGGRAFRGQAFQQALSTAGDAIDTALTGALRLRRGLAAGVDVRI